MKGSLYSYRQSFKDTGSKMGHSKGKNALQMKHICKFSASARIHRWTGMDGVRAAEGGEGVTGAMIRGLEFG